jgi:hypothetical protein
MNVASQPSRRPLVRAGLAIGLSLTALAAGLAASQRGSAEPGSALACPAGAPLRSYDVRAIDVDITLNRFGDHDPAGRMFVLGGRLDDVRAQEAAGTVSLGLRDDAIQPLVIRANLGDCVRVNLANEASGGRIGIHIDDLALSPDPFGVAGDKDRVPDPRTGRARSYTFYVPEDPLLEGAHHIRPGADSPEAEAHGLFGALVVEPAGSTYVSPADGQPIESGWEAVIVPPGRPSFREAVQLYHEVGGADVSLLDGADDPLAQEDPYTGASDPATRAISYRSEPFMNRLALDPRQESQGYGSYTFGDPATPTMQSYLGDPTKVRILNASAEDVYRFHLHGGLRWPTDPHQDPAYDYAATGLSKLTSDATSSPRTDSQAFGPGEAYDLQIEGGAGGAQQSAGDFLYHSRIREHSLAGMWGFWRVFDTSRPGLAALPDRTSPAQPVDSAGLIGSTYNGTTLTAENLDAWIRAQLPSQGVPTSDQDASVWNWTVDTADPAAPVYLGEPEDTGAWPDLPGVVPDHPGLLPGDEVVGDRPKILFNPANGRVSHPLLRTHAGQRPPFAPNGHSGAPYLGERVDAAIPGSTDPYDGRPDAVCPSDAPIRDYNLVAIESPASASGETIYVRAADKDDVLAGRTPAEPLALDAGVGDCVAVTLTSERGDAADRNGFSKTSLHVGDAQVDVQGSDGLISGMAYEQSVRPYAAEGLRLTVRARGGATLLRLSDVESLTPGASIGVGLGTEDIEIAQVTEVDPARGTVTLDRPLTAAHAAGQYAGTEFARYRWYPDLVLDGIFAGSPSLPGGSPSDPLPPPPPRPVSAPAEPDAPPIAPRPRPLPTLSPLPGPTAWVGDFENGALSQWTNRSGGVGVQRVADDRVRLVGDPVAQGRNAVRIEVRQGDVWQGSPGNRAELVKWTGETEGDEAWYQWSTMFAPDFPHESTQWQIWTQWHTDRGGTQPMLKFWASNDTIGMSTTPADATGHPLTTTTHWTAPIDRGQWHAIRLHVRWSSSKDRGFVELWHDGVQVVPPTPAATLLPDGSPNYLKQGLYRSASIGPTAVLYHDAMTMTVVR